MNKRNNLLKDLSVSLFGIIISGFFLYLFLFYLDDSNWPIYVKILWFIISFLGFFSSLVGFVVTFFKISLQKKFIILSILLLIYYFMNLSIIHNVLKVKLSEKWRKYSNLLEHIREEDKVFKVIERERNAYRIIFDNKGRTIGLIGYNIRRYSLIDGKVIKEDLFKYKDFSTFGIKLSPFVDGLFDKDGNLWVLTLAGDIFRFNNNRWKLIASHPDRNNQFFDHIAKPKGKDYIYIYTDRGKKPTKEKNGIWIYDIENKLFKKISSEYITDMISYGDKVIIARGLSIFEISENGNIKELIKFDKKYRWIEKLEVLPNGILAIGFSKGLLTLDNTGNTQEILYEKDAKFDIRGIARLKNSKFVLALWDEGLYVQIDAVNWRRYGLKEGLWSEKLYTLKADNKGNIWVSSSHNRYSIVFFYPESFMKKIVSLKIKKLIPEEKIFVNAFKAVNTIYKGKQIFEGPIKYFRWNGDPYVFFYSDPVYPPGLYRAYAYITYSLGYYKQKGTFSVVLYDKILFVKDGQPIYISFSEVKNITKIFIDKENILWIGTRKGLYFYDGSDFIKVKEIGDMIVTDIIQDSRAHLWVGTWGYLFTYNGSRWISYKGDRKLLEKYLTSRRYNPSMRTYENAPCNFLPSSNISDLQPLSDGRVAIATDDGLAIFNNNKFKCFHRYENIPSSSLIKVNEDKDGRIWMISIDGGIFWFKGLFYTYHITDKRKGIFSSDIGDVIYDGKGSIWVMDKSGKIGIYPLKYFY
jgi:hypothetical protein